MALTVMKPVWLPIAQLKPYPDPLKKPIGPRQMAGLRASLREFSFCGILNVALDADGLYVVLDGNSRFEELTAAGVPEVPCYVHDGMAHTAPDHLAKRRKFYLAFDRHRKVFDEQKVLADLKDLVAKGADPQDMAVLSGVEKLKRILEEDAAPKAQETLAKAQAAVPDNESLILYGPREEIAQIKALLHSIKGKFTATQKVEALLRQADADLDVEDETFLGAFLAALGRFQSAMLGGAGAAPADGPPEDAPE